MVNISKHHFAVNSVVVILLHINNSSFHLISVKKVIFWTIMNKKKWNINHVSYEDKQNQKQRK